MFAARIESFVRKTALIAIVGVCALSQASVSSASHVYQSGGGSGGGGGGGGGNSGSGGGGHGGGGHGGGGHGGGGEHGGRGGSESWDSGRSRGGSDGTYRGSGDYGSQDRNRDRSGSSKSGSSSFRDDSGLTETGSGSSDGSLDSFDRDDDDAKDSLDFSVGGSGSSGSGSDSSDDDSDFSNSGSGSSGSGSGTSDDDDDDSSNSGSGSSNSGSGSSDDDDDDDDSSNSGSGSSNSGSDSRTDHDAMAWRNLGAAENPEFDRSGFPTRRGEVIALDLSKPHIQAARQQGFSVVGKTNLSALGSEMFRLRAPKGMAAVEALQRLRAISPGTFFELDHYFGVTGGERDASPGSKMIDMKLTPGKPLWIGMIDTAVWNQATLRSARIESQDFANKSGKPPYAHGTAIASILHRHGAARITSANVFKTGGRPYSSAEAIARAVNWMVDRKVPVINISIAGPQNALVDRVISQARSRGHLIVAAAGNAGPTAPPAYPAASPGALAVTAIDRQGRVYMKANRGNHIEISAIGVGVGAEAPDGALKPHSGTSFAAPFVSAALARCLGKVNPQQAGVCVKQMEVRALDLGQKGRDPIYGYGMLVP